MEKQDNNWKELRKKRLKEYLVFSYVISLLLIWLSLRDIIYFFDINNYLSFSYIFIPAFLIIIYYFTNYLKKRTFLVEPSKKNYLIFLIFITTITLLIFRELNFDRYLIKIIYFAPIILATVNYGQKFGLYIASYSSINLVILNLLLQDFSNIDFDIIIVIIFFWVAWLIGGFTDLERRIQKHLEKLAITDNLTGLPNYARFHNVLTSYIEKAELEDIPLSLAIMDIDNFKFYNDSLGHQKGDQLLKKLATIAKRYIGKDVFLARYGGDEFVFLFLNYKQQAACNLITKLKEKVQSEIEIPYEQLLENKFSFSFGIACFPEQAQNKKELIDMADHALYLAKSTQKDQVKVYHEALSELAATLVESEIELFNAVRTLLSIINVKDRYTYGHSERVMNYAEKFAERLGLSFEDKKKLMYGGFLHDVGKIEIERKILMKPKKLSRKEWDKMESHPEIGAKILSPLNFCDEIIPMVLYHHENYDGSGYKKKLQGEKIPFYARILRIIDSYDAMNSKRPYSNVLSKEKIIKELEDNAGVQFDPELVVVFIEMLKEKVI